MEYFKSENENFLLVCICKKQNSMKWKFHYALSIKKHANRQFLDVEEIDIFYPGSFQKNLSLRVLNQP